MCKVAEQFIKLFYLRLARLSCHRLVWPITHLTSSLPATISLCAGGGVVTAHPWPLNLGWQHSHLTVAGEAHAWLRRHGDDMLSNIAGIYWRTVSTSVLIFTHRKLKHGAIIMLFCFFIFKYGITVVFSAFTYNLDYCCTVAAQRQTVRSYVFHSQTQRWSRH